MLIQELIRSASLYRGQASGLLTAVVAPWIGNALTVFRWNPFPDLDLTPFAFTISGLAVAWSLFRFRLLEIVPVAREAVFESMDDAVIVLDEQNRVVDLNLAAQRLAHRTASEAVGQPFTQVFSSWPELVQHYAHMPEAQAEVVLGDGASRRCFDLHISLLHRRNGHLSVTGRLIVLNEITEHKRAERALRESEERFRNIFEEAPIGMAVVGLDGTLLQVNKAFCEMLGYREQELLAANLSAMIHPNDLGTDKVLSMQVLKGAITSYKVEKRYLRKNGETLWADLTATALRNQDGLAQIAASAHQHLQAFASHHPPRSPDARQELNRALELAQLSVKEARRLIAGLRPTALADFGLATALRLQIEAQRNEGWTITYDETLGSERLPPTIETTLYWVALEALTNVRKHAGTARVRLALERQESTIHLEIQDWGRGFEPLAALREASLGEHLGLREMQERVELVGGHLTVSSRPGVGTLVVAVVPLPSPDNERSTFHER